MEFSTTVYTYRDLKEGLILGRDDYGIAAKCSPPLQETFKNNPFLVDDEKLFMLLGRVDDIAAAIGISFPTSVKAGNDIVNSTGGSTLEVYEMFRKYELGVDIMLYPFQHSGFDFLLYAGISEQALKLYRKLKFTVFEYPRAMRICNARCILESKGLHGAFLRISSFIVNCFLKALYGICSLFHPSYKAYNIRRLESVPLWVDEMVLNDGHKYMELHDQKWFQWNLNYNLHAEKDDIQSLYGIYKGETPVAFFMTKERFRELAGDALKNIVIGSIMEWGIDKESGLRESDIYRMAIKTFRKKVDIIEFATEDKEVVSKMKKSGFIQHGYAHIVLKDLTKKYKDAKDISLWRIRFAYSDVFLT